MKNYKRRAFVKKSLLSSMAATLGMPIVFGRYLPEGMVPIGVEIELNTIPGKRADMIILNDRPINAETPAHLLQDALTPNDLFFVRNNGIPPARVDVDNWELAIGGESAETEKKYSLQDLKSKFKNYS